MLALAGLSAGARGVHPLVDLVIVGGAASWIGMLWTALRPGQSPNVWQKVLAGLAWLMPITMLILSQEFSLNFILLSIASATCVTMIVVVYPSQSYTPTMAADRRLEVHLAGVAKAASEGDAANQGQGANQSQVASAAMLLNGQAEQMQSMESGSIAQALELTDNLRAALLEEGVPAGAIDSAMRRMSGGAVDASASTLDAGQQQAASLDQSRSLDQAAPSADLQVGADLVEGSALETELVQADPMADGSTQDGPTQVAAVESSPLADSLLEGWSVDGSQFVAAVDEEVIEDETAASGLPDVDLTAEALPSSSHSAESNLSVATDGALSTEADSTTPSFDLDALLGEDVLSNPATLQDEALSLMSDAEGEPEGVKAYRPESADVQQAAAPKPEPVEVVRARSRVESPSRWDAVQGPRKGTVGGGRGDQG